MKKILTTLVACMFGSAQAQITLQSTDMPVSDYNVLEMTSGFSSPLTGNNQMWNYGMFSGSNLTSYYYPTETDTFFTQAGIDYVVDGTKNFNSQFIYYIANEYDMNTNAFEEKGHYVPAQSYSLQATTGNANDSLKMPEQKSILTDSRIFFKYPMTMGSTWQSQCKKVTDFTLTVSLYGMNNTPAQHKYTTFKTDSVVGWGKMTIYTASGPSIPYDVLMIKTRSYVVDSFFLSGSPAPAPLLQAFGVSQGQILSHSNQYNFYRSGSVNYLARFHYANDTTMSTVPTAYFSTDNIITSTDKNSLIQSSIIFPNPSQNGTYQIYLIGYQSNKIKYSVLNLYGQEVQQGEAFLLNGAFSVALDSNIPKGNYILRVNSNNGESIITEKIIYQ